MARSDAAAAQNPAAGQSTGAIALSWSAVPARPATTSTAGRAVAHMTHRPAQRPHAHRVQHLRGPRLGAHGRHQLRVRRAAVTAGQRARTATSSALCRSPVPSAGDVTGAPPAGRSRSGGRASPARRGTTSTGGSPPAPSTLRAAQRRNPVSTASFNDLAATNGKTYRYVIRSVVDGAGGAALESLTTAPKVPPRRPMPCLRRPPRSPIRVAAARVHRADRQRDDRARVSPRSGCSTRRQARRHGPAGAQLITPSRAASIPAAADGVYDVRALAADLAGNTTASATVASRRIDNTPPTVTMDDPGGYIRGTVTLSALRPTRARASRRSPSSAHRPRRPPGRPCARTRPSPTRAR